MFPDSLASSLSNQTAQIVSIEANDFDSRIVLSKRRVGRHTRTLAARGWALCVCLPIACAGAVLAQTAHFSNTQSPIGDGGGGPVAVDEAGNVYLAATHLLVKATVAPGYIYTLSTATTSVVNPEWIAVDGHGNVYIDGDSEIVKETPSAHGYMESVLFSGRNFEGVAADRLGNLYIADETHLKVVKETPSGASYVESTVADFSVGPTPLFGGVAIDDRGDVFVRDQTDGESSHVFGYKVSGGVYSGFFEVSVFASGGIAVDTQGSNLYTISAFGSFQKTSIPSGSGTALPLNVSGESEGIAVDRTGNVYFTDSGVYRVSFAGAGTLGAIQVGSTGNMGFANFFVDSGATIGSRAVVTEGTAVLDFRDTTTPAYGTCQPGTAGSGGTLCSVYVTLRPKAPGARYGAAELLDSSGRVMARAYFQGTGVSPLVSFYPGALHILGGGFYGPFGVAVDAAGTLYVADTGNNRVLKKGSSSSSWTSIGSGLSGPTAVALDGAGNVYIADTGHKRVLIETLSAGGYTQTLVRGGLGSPVGIAVDGSGNVYVADALAAKVVKETPSATGYIQTTIPAHGLASPTSVAVDGGGNLYIVDSTLAHAVKETLAAGTYTQSNVAAGFTQAYGIAVDGVGNVFVSDTARGVVVRVTTSGTAYLTQNTVATGLSSPGQIAVDSRGNLYVANSSASQVVEEDFADAPRLAFAPTPVGLTSGSRTVQLWNIGNQKLTFEAPRSGTNPSVSNHFILNDTEVAACPVIAASGAPATLAPGGHCMLQVQFHPSMVGALSGTLSVTDDALNGMAPSYKVQSLALQGVGKAD